MKVRFRVNQVFPFSRLDTNETIDRRIFYVWKQTKKYRITFYRSNSRFWILYNLRVESKNFRIQLFWKIIFIWKKKSVFHISCLFSRIKLSIILIERIINFVYSWQFLNFNFLIYLKNVILFSLIYFSKSHISLYHSLERKSLMKYNL